MIAYRKCCEDTTKLLLRHNLDTKYWIESKLRKLRLFTRCVHYTIQIRQENFIKILRLNDNFLTYKHTYKHQIASFQKKTISYYSD